MRGLGLAEAVEQPMENLVAHSPEAKLALRQEVARLTGREVSAAEIYSTVRHMSSLDMLVVGVRDAPRWSHPHPARVVLALAPDWVATFRAVRQNGRVQCGGAIAEWSFQEMVGTRLDGLLGVDLRIAATGERWALTPTDLSVDAGLIYRHFVGDG